MMWQASCLECQIEHSCRFDVTGALRKTLLEVHRLRWNVAKTQVTVPERLFIVVWRLVLLQLGWPSHLVQHHFNRILDEILFGMFGVSVLNPSPGMSVLVLNSSSASHMCSFLVGPDGVSARSSVSAFSAQDRSGLDGNALELMLARTDPEQGRYAVAKSLLFQFNYQRRDAQPYDRIFVNRRLDQTQLVELRSWLAPEGRLVAAGVYPHDVMAVQIDRDGDSFSQRSIPTPANKGEGANVPCTLAALCLRRLVTCVDLTGHHREVCGRRICQGEPSPFLKGLKSVYQRLLDGEVGDGEFFGFVTSTFSMMEVVVDQRFSSCNFAVHGMNYSPLSIFRELTGERCRFLRDAILFDPGNSSAADAPEVLQHREELLASLRGRSQPTVEVSREAVWTLVQELTVSAARLVSDMRALQILLKSPLAPRASVPGSMPSRSASRIQTYCHHVTQQADFGLVTWRNVHVDAEIFKLTSTELRTCPRMDDVSVVGAFEMLLRSIRIRSQLFEGLPQHTCGSASPGSGFDVDLFNRELGRLNAQVPELVATRADIFSLIAARFLEDAWTLIALVENEEEKEAVIQLASDPQMYLRHVLAHLFDDDVDVNCLILGTCISEVFG